MGEKREKVCISIICVGILGIYRRTRHQEAPTFLLSPLSPLLQANENGNFYFLFQDENGEDCLLLLYLAMRFWCYKKIMTFGVVKVKVDCISSW